MQTLRLITREPIRFKLELRINPPLDVQCPPQLNMDLLIILAVRQEMIIQIFLINSKLFISFKTFLTAHLDNANSEHKNVNNNKI